MSRGTQEAVPGSPKSFAYRTFTFYGVGFQPLRLPLGFVTSRGRCAFLQTAPTTPYVQRAHAFTYVRFRLFPVRSPLLRESQLISFPPGTKMFQFPGCMLSGKQCLPEMFRLSSERVSPFGDPGITGCLLLPRAYRSLPRPSSTPLPRHPLYTHKQDSHIISFYLLVRRFYSDVKEQWRRGDLNP